MKLMLISCASLLVVTASSAQLSVHGDWQVSLDNGATWQTGAVTDQSQTSVLVRAVTTVRQQGVPVVSGSGPIVAALALEGWSTTSSANTDSISAAWLLASSIPTATLQQRSFVSRRQGGVLFADRPSDTSGPGQGSGLDVINLAGPLGTNPSFQNPLPVFQMRVSLDGTAGDRTFSGAITALQATTFVGVISVPAGFAAVGNPSSPATWDYVPISQTPATLTIIPAPAALPLLAAGSLLAMRRRR